MKLLYIYEYNNGGFADMIKYFLVAVFIAEKYSLDLYIKIQHPINNYLVINEKYICNFDINSIEYLSKEKNLKYMIDNKKDFIYTTLSYFNESINQKDFPNSSFLFEKYNLFDYINYSLEIYNYVNNIMENNKYYISIHLRCGDKHILNSKDFHEDNRIFNVNYEELINNIIKKNQDKEIYFFCDNNEIKKNIINKYSKLKYLFNNPILHVSYDNTDIYTNEIINNTFKQTLIEFLFICKCNEIQSLTYSGFSLIAHLLGKKKNKFVKYYKLT